MARRFEVTRVADLMFKRANRTEGKEALAHEARVLRHLEGMTGVPEVVEADDGLLVTRWIEAQSLRPWAAKAPHAQRRVVARALVERVAALHQRGVVHRDLKPSHVLIDPRLGVHVIDFDLASFDGVARRGGTPGYAAPETTWLPDPRAIDIRADVYSVGLLLRLLLLDEQPATTPTEVATALLSPRAQPRTGEAAWIGWMLEPLREQRMPDLKLALRALDGQPVIQRADPSPIAHLSPQGGSPTPRQRELLERARTLRASGDDGEAWEALDLELSLGVVHYAAADRDPARRAALARSLRAYDLALELLEQADDTPHAMATAAATLADTGHIEASAKCLVRALRGPIPQRTGQHRWFWERLVHALGRNSMLDDLPALVDLFQSSHRGQIVLHALPAVAAQCRRIRRRREALLDATGPFRAPAEIALDAALVQAANTAMCLAAWSLHVHRDQKPARFALLEAARALASTEVYASRGMAIHRAVSLAEAGSSADQIVEAMRPPAPEPTDELPAWAVEDDGTANGLDLDDSVDLFADLRDAPTSPAAWEPIVAAGLRLVTHRPAIAAPLHELLATLAVVGVPGWAVRDWHARLAA